MSTHLGLPPFHHHRADDDAAICGQIFAAMIPMLRELGVERVSQMKELGSACGIAVGSAVAALLR